jgi:hypothetical protein
MVKQSKEKQREAQENMAFSCFGANWALHKVSMS